jgi:hypothetical protein
MAKDDIISIDVRSGVNEKGAGFITIVATTEDKEFKMGQVDPKTLRGMALQFLEAAEAAETDAIIYKLLQNKFRLDLPAVAMFISEIREMRED